MMNLTYRQWMTEVEHCVERATGCSFDMLPDWLSHDSYSEGLSVAAGAQACLEQVGFANFEERVLVDEL